MHEVIVLLRGHAELTSIGNLRATATVTLIKGAPNVVVDTGDAWQRDDITAALDGAGLQPSDIAHVINTHGHLDHIGNNSLFPHATFVLDGDVARDGEYWLHDFKRAPYLIESAAGVAPIRVEATPGHTDHDLSVLVTTSIGRVAIVGDLFERGGDWIDNAWRNTGRRIPNCSERIANECWRMPTGSCRDMVTSSAWNAPNRSHEMRRSLLAVTGLAIAFAAACSSTDASAAPPIGNWGSSLGSLVVGDTSADLQIASGSCYAASGHLSGRIPGGNFTLAGTFTQIVGVSPGFRQYAAQFTGTADSSTISVTITVPALGQTVGPLSVSSGVTKTLTQCLVP